MNYRKQQWILALVLLSALALVIGCEKKVAKTPEPPPPAPKPPTATLSANPTSIQRGQSATLTWSTETATDIALEGNKVDASGSQTVSPTDTTTYHLSAKGPGGTQDVTATVNVTAPPAPVARTVPSETDEAKFARLVSDIYFDYDKAELRPDAQQMLGQAAELVKAHPEWRVQIEGNCDERGSGMYNLALGERRADVARQVLVQGGVGTVQLKSISYGKEKPVCSEANEECWQKNRHDHFVLLH